MHDIHATHVKLLDLFITVYRQYFFFLTLPQCGERYVQ